MDYYKQEGNRKNEHKKLILRVKLKPERFPPNLDAKDIFFFMQAKKICQRPVPPRKGHRQFLVDGKISVLGLTNGDRNIWRRY